MGPIESTGIVEGLTLGISTSLVPPLGSSMRMDTGRDRGEGNGATRWL